MADQFLAEIRIFSCNFAPQGWASCNGQILPISQNTALFSLLGTTYGGDGKTNFALPNLQGSAPLHSGQGLGLTRRSLGEVGGEASVTLLSPEMPSHTHLAQGSNIGGGQNSPEAGVWSIPQVARGLNAYDPSPGNSPTMNPLALATAGGNQPHDNMMPYLTLNFCIALQGIFPMRS